MAHTISPRGQVIVLALILWTIPGIAPAQGSVSIPKDTTYEGIDYSYNLGSYAEARFQYVYGALKGNRYTFKDVLYRLDYRNHLSGLSISRTWSNVTLAVSETRNYAQLSPTFSFNNTGAVSVVFNAAVAWPTQSGLPVTYPALWGSLSGKLRFPFATPFKYTGTDDLMLDYTFRGGQLGNNGTWGGQFPVLRHYTLDGEDVGTSSVSGLARLIPQNAPVCNDSFFTSSSTVPAQAEGACKVSGATASTVLVEYRTILTALNAPVIHAVGLAGGLPGINIGAKCNNLHVDLTQPWVAAIQTAGPRFAGTPMTRHTVKWTNGLSRLKLYIQGAWTDSQSGAFGLTTTLELILPGAPPPSQLPRQKTLYSRFANDMTAEVGPFYSAYNPYVRFVTQ